MWAVVHVCSSQRDLPLCSCESYELSDKHQKLTFTRSCLQSPGTFCERGRLYDPQCKCWTVWHGSSGLHMVDFYLSFPPGSSALCWGSPAAAGGSVPTVCCLFISRPTPPFSSFCSSVPHVSAPCILVFFHYFMACLYITSLPPPLLAL